ncbi:Immunity protein 22 of polymorphic toxin system [Flavobacterium branchiophilum]|uniref:Immunity protein 22 of polymorphic toxin system n=1 Tax=Flavobacterium branchiophilum (strain FL-15) TaxID=1034807 RepID=G2Z5L8_FLABF|nr:immunity 22 family protein [Flavobacterium branchiophilum]CCB70816.1 Hypothetical protein FBFL15_2840 [Flavobacterium branchiophilum FL-15]
MDYTDKIFLWLGIFNGSKNEFNLYFDQSKGYLLDEYGNDRLPEEIELSQFSKDLGEDFTYDEDFIGYLLFPNSIEILEILEEVPINHSEKESVIKKCIELGLNDANAVYWYSDEITPNPNISYNGLKYIGEYLAE